MTGPHITQLDRDQLDDHNLIDHEPAGDDPEETRTAPVISVRQHRAGAVRTHQTAR